MSGNGQRWRRLGLIKDLKLPLMDPLYEIIDPKVQLHVDIAVVTLNLVNYGTLGVGEESIVARRNPPKCTLVIEEQWRIIHCHWS